MYKTKKGSKEKIKCQKVRLGARGFFQVRELITRDLFPDLFERLFENIYDFDGHFNLEVHQMDVRTAFFFSSPIGSLYDSAWRKSKR